MRQRLKATNNHFILGVFSNKKQLTFVFNLNLLKLNLGNVIY